MNEFWTPVPGDNPSGATLNDIGDGPITETIADYVTANPTTSRVEYDGSTMYHTNFVFQSANTEGFDIVVNGEPARAELVGGPHSPQRPK